MPHSFQVDLRGLVDLLSRHLYSSPRVYVRELLQNAVDAITAREALAASGAAPGAVPEILVEPSDGDGPLRVSDNGIGLTEPQVHRLLATIGNSSKRDDLGFARHDFLGQFGIGLLSCFLVADEVEVITRSAAEPGAPTIRWVGHAEGTYTVEETSPRETPGTTVVLRSRRDFGHWLSAPTVIELARHYGSMLSYRVTVGDTVTTEDGLPWRRTHDGPEERRDALLAYGRKLLGVQPFDVIDLAVGEAGLTGVAFVLPDETGAATTPEHRVYLKRMLLGTKVDGLLPEWAFFVRCVVDTAELRPTAARERLYDDDLLAATRDALGERLREWLVDLAATDPERLSAFLAVHHRGVLALAADGDAAMLRIADAWIPFETSEGPLPPAALRSRHRTIYHTLTAEEFRQFSGIAAAQGVCLVNGGYTHHGPVLRRLPSLDPDLEVRPLEPDVLATSFEEPDAATAFAARDFLAAAATALDRHGCVPVLRGFAPAELPVLYLEDRDVRDAARLREEREDAEGVWNDLLSLGPEPEEAARPMLVFNHRNPVVRRLTTTPDTAVAALSAEALYGYALLASNRPMAGGDAATVNRAFLGLVEHAVRR